MATTQANRLTPLPGDVLAILHYLVKPKGGQPPKLTQAALAGQLGVSPAAVNQAVHDKFQGNAEKFCLRVRGLFGGASVACPVLGQINTKVCLDQQSRPLSHTNPQRVALARACKTCLHKQCVNTGAEHAQ
jgi:hypothetical protein